MSAFTTNLNPNSSLESNLTGYTALLGSTLTRTSADALSGQYSMQAATPGLAIGEGFTGPVVVTTVTGPGSMTIGLSGTSGTVSVSAIGQWGPGGTTVLGQQTVTLTPAWQTVKLDGLAFVSGSGVYVLVLTTGSSQALHFLADCVQYEPESPSHRYCDGSLPGCAWLGTPFASASVQAVQNALTLFGSTITEGSIALSLSGEIFTLILGTGTVTSGGSIDMDLISPSGVFDDFAIFGIGETDPAMSYAGWNTAGLLTGRASYTRPWGIFYPPLDYPVSDGSLLWPRAAFAAAVQEFVGIPAGAAENLTGVQVEMVPLAGTLGLDQVPVPAAYDTPRSIRVIAVPTRLNYSPNPGFETSLAYWSAVGSATIAQDSSVWAGGAATWDGQLITASPASMLVTCPYLTGGAALAVSGLILGDTYTASVYVLPRTTGIADFQVNAGGYASSLGAESIFTGSREVLYGSGAYGSDDYGGDNPGGVVSVSLPTASPDGSDAWVRLSVTFTAPSETVTFSVQPVPVLGAAAPVQFSLDQSLVEAGSVTGSYFDGSQGNPDYLWEGTPGQSRSYWYENFAAGQVTLEDILRTHTPLGISAGNPAYLTLPTQ